jgi:hypothetical protein
VSQPQTQQDEAQVRVAAQRSALVQRDALIEALRYALPPGKWAKAITITREPDGALAGVVVREARV